MRKKIITALILLSFLGFWDTVYLTFHHYQNTTPTCTLKYGCDIVLTSKFATLGTIPVALLGAIYYLLVLAYGIALLRTRKKTLIVQLVILNLVGFIVSIILFLIQAFILHAFCIYCIFSEVISLLLLIFSVILLRLRYEQKSES